MEDVDHNNRLQSTGGEWQLRPIQDNVNSATLKNLGRNQVRYKVLQEARP
jgi:hypothetical protein